MVQLQRSFELELSICPAGISSRRAMIALQIQRHVRVADLLERPGNTDRNAIGREFRQFRRADLDAGQAC